MEAFEGFSSNTIAPSGNQSWFYAGASSRECTGRSFYRIFSGGSYHYKFLFSNTVDSTYGDGTHSRANLLCDEWKICSLKCCVCAEGTEFASLESSEMREVLFDGNSEKTVAPGELFFTDPVRLSAKKGDYICLEIRFSGRRIPYLEETLIPSFLLENGIFMPDNRVPLAGMIACDRRVKDRIAFLGDSITEGIGAGFHTYDFWCSQAAELLGDEYSFWNLGLGYGRAQDAATDGSWLLKAKQADFVSVCLGVNDIIRGDSEQEIRHNLNRIVQLLKEHGCRVGVFTVPPFDFEAQERQIWCHVNAFIRTELSRDAAYVFDVVPILGESAQRCHIAKYGGHPNALGCRLLAERFCEFIREKRVFWN